MNYYPTSGKFRIPQSIIIRQLFFRYGLKYTAITGAVWLILLIAGCIFDLRLIILSFMILFIVFPAIAAFLYFFYGLQPATALNSMEHSVAILPSAIKVTIYPSTTDNDDDNRETIERVFPQSLYAGYSPTNGGIVICLRSQGLMIVPYSAYEDTEQFKSWLDALKNME